MRELSEATHSALRQVDVLGRRCASKIETVEAPSFAASFIQVASLLAVSFVFVGCANDPILKFFAASSIDDRFGPNPAVTDSDAPTTPTVPAWASTFGTSTSQTSNFSWGASTDAGSGLAKYEVALGTTSGASDTVAWTSVGTNQSYTFPTASLATGAAYFASVRAVDIAGNTSAIATTPYLFTVITETPTLDLDFTSMTMLPPTVRYARSGGYAGSFVDSTGLIRTGRTNFLLQSEAFGTTWTKNATSVSSDVAVSPNHGTTGDAILETATTAAHSVSQSVAGLLSGTSYTLSVYAKASGRTQLAISLSSVAFPTAPAAVFDLQSGTLISAGTGGATATLSNEGNGWYRVRLTAVAGANGAGISTFGLRDGTGAVVGASSYLGDVTKGVALWGAQLEDADSISSQVYTTTAASFGPRFDYDPSTCTPGPCQFRGLNIEGARANRVLQNSSMTSASWTKTNLTAATSTQASPMATVTSQLVTETTDSVATTHSLSQGSLAMSANVNHAASVYVKPNGRSRFTLAFNRVATSDAVSGDFDLVAKTATASATGAGLNARANLQSLPNGWYRIEISGNVSTAAVNATMSLTAANASGTSYVGDGTSGFYVWGFQFETGQRASSVIPTTTVAVTRNADGGSLNYISSWVGTAGGTLSFQGKLAVEDSTVFPVIVRLCVALNCNANKAEFQLYGVHPAYVYLNNNSNLFYVSHSVVTYTTTSPIRGIYAFTTNDFRAASNGLLTVADSSGALVQGDQLSFNGQAWFTRLTYWRQRLTDAQLEAYSR